MNILMMTNTYEPFVGGVERSIQMFSDEYRKRGHRVIIVAPTFEGMPDRERDVVRVPALQKFNGTDFSVQLPVPGVLNRALEDVTPDIVHSHHPYLVGDTALRLAAKHDVPLVFTFHTFYERYTHYVPLDSPGMKRFVISLATGYANLCNRIFAPSESVATELVRRGVASTIDVVPTGVDTGSFASGDATGFREGLNLPPEAFVIGFVSRLAPEKNIAFLTRCVGEFMQKDDDAYFVVIGKGPSRQNMLKALSEFGVHERVRAPGTLEGHGLVDAYHAMDVFAFASTTETQGMVVTESLAAGVPVVAVDAPGVRDVVRNGKDGILVAEKEKPFIQALRGIRDMSEDAREEMRARGRQRARQFDMSASAGKALTVYRHLHSTHARFPRANDEPLRDALRLVKAEWDVLANMTRATGAAFGVKGKRATVL
ncbi:MAG: glycosyltransferase [Chitinivibrionales bacterium]|nr:glycosyltransferase [Chitinivibrionales bacterium]MBD3396503.1 glycosyltransferase [Chitinivibrionales bacterium]